MELSVNKVGNRGSLRWSFFNFSVTGKSWGVFGGDLGVSRHVSSSIK
jgi:hypothetical protein